MRNESITDCGLRIAEPKSINPKSEILKLNSKGVSLIAAIFIIVILAFMGVMFVSLINTASFTSVNDLQSAQALYLAESGIEYALVNQTFPNYSATANLGAGSFTVASPTITSGLTITTAATINVPSTPLTKFPAALGRIVIDSEVITYNAFNGTSFTGATRGVAGTQTQHLSGVSVYPVTTLSGALGNLATNIPVAANGTTGFEMPGVIIIDDEYIYCQSTSGGNQFTNCARGYKGTVVPPTHVAGSNVFQYSLTSTGNVGGAQRAVVVQSNKDILFDNSSGGQVNNTSNSITFNHTVFGGLDRVLLVGVDIRNNSRSVIDVSCPGCQAFSRIGFDTSTGGSAASNTRAELWYSPNPPVGVNSITITLSNTAYAVAGSISLQGASQRIPTNFAVLATNTTNAPSLPVVTQSRYSWVCDSLAIIGSSTTAAAAGQIERWNNPSQPNAGVTGAGSTKGTIFLPQTVTMLWNNSGNVKSAQVAAEIQSVVNALFWKEVVK